MTTEILGLDDLEQSQSQPHVPINRTSRRIEASIAGTVHIDVTEDSDIDIPTDDEPASWRYAVIVIQDGGNALTAPRDVIFPDLSGLDPAIVATPRFELQNDTLQTLTVKGSGGTGVEVPAGESRLVRWDGEDVVPVAGSGGSGGPGTADLGMFAPGQPTASQLLFKFVAARAMTFPADFTGSYGHIGTNPTSTYTLDIDVAGSTVGTIEISTGGAFTFATSGGTSKPVAAGEEIEIIASGTPDDTAADISVTLVADL